MENRYRLEVQGHGDCYTDHVATLRAALSLACDLVEEGYAVTVYDEQTGLTVYQG